MATRYGWEKAEKLKQKGWKVDEDRDHQIIGDPVLIDPENGLRHSPYEAEKIQQARDIFERFCND